MIKFESDQYYRDDESYFKSLMMKYDYDHNEYLEKSVQAIEERYHELRRGYSRLACAPDDIEKKTFWREFEIFCEPRSTYRLEGRAK